MVENGCGGEQVELQKQQWRDKTKNTLLHHITTKVRLQPAPYSIYTAGMMPLNTPA